MTSFHAEKCCRLVSEHKASARRLSGNIRQFLIVIKAQKFTSISRIVESADPKVTYFGVCSTLERRLVAHSNFVFLA